MMPLPPWAVLAMLAPALVAAAAGASWVLVRSEAGGIVRHIAELLSVLGHTVQWKVPAGADEGAPAAPWETVPVPGLLAWGLRLPHRMLGCAGCTSWWMGVGGVGVGAWALHVDAGSTLLLALLVAPAAAGLGAFLDAAWLALVLHAEWVRVRTAGIVEATPAPLNPLADDASTVAGAVMWAGAPEEAPVAPPTDNASPHPDLAPDDGAPLPPIPATRARSLHPSMPVPRPPVADGTPA